MPGMGFCPSQPRDGWGGCLSATKHRGILLIRSLALPARTGASCITQNVFTKLSTITNQENKLAIFVGELNFQTHVIITLCVKILRTITEAFSIWRCGWHGVYAQARYNNCSMRRIKAAVRMTCPSVLLEFRYQQLCCLLATSEQKKGQLKTLKAFHLKAKARSHNLKGFTNFDLKAKAIIGP